MSVKIGRTVIMVATKTPTKSGLGSTNLVARKSSCINGKNATYLLYVAW